MTSQSNTPSTTPQSFDPPVNVDWDAINKRWQERLDRSPLDMIKDACEWHRANGSSADVVRALSLLWSDVWFVHGGGHQAMAEKK